MKSITLKSIPRSIHTAFKQRAAQNGRSLNKEIFACLEMSIAPVRVDIQAWLYEIQDHRATLPGHLNEHLIQRATDEGRP